MEIQKVEEYEQLSDEELLELRHKGREGLEDYLIDKYKGMVLKKAHAMYLMGGEPEDLIQEGMIGLFKAVRGYRPDKNASFSTFANLCVERQMYKAIEISGRQKHRPLNSYISLSEEDSPLKNAEDTVWQNPEDIVIDRRARTICWRRFRENSALLRIRCWRLIWQGRIMYRLPDRWSGNQSPLTMRFREYEIKFME